MAVLAEQRVPRPPRPRAFAFRSASIELRSFKVASSTKACRSKNSCKRYQQGSRSTTSPQAPAHRQGGLPAGPGIPALSTSLRRHRQLRWYAPPSLSSPSAGRDDYAEVLTERIGTQVSRLTFTALVSRPGGRSGRVLTRAAVQGSPSWFGWCRRCDAISSGCRFLRPRAPPRWRPDDL